MVRKPMAGGEGNTSCWTPAKIPQLTQIDSRVDLRYPNHPQVCHIQLPCIIIIIIINACYHGNHVHTHTVTHTFVAIVSLGVLNVSQIVDDGLVGHVSSKGSHITYLELTSPALAWIWLWRGKELVLSRDVSTTNPPLRRVEAYFSVLPHTCHLSPPATPTKENGIVSN